MKKTFPLFILILSINLCYSQSKKEFLKDLIIYKEIIETSHSGIYLYTSKDEFDAIFKKVKEDIMTDKITTHKDFYLQIAKIHTKINSGHSSAYFGKALYPDPFKKPNKKILFPLKVKFIKDTLVLKSNYKTLKKGTKILSINCKSVEDIVKDAFSIISADGFNTTYKYHTLEHDFTFYYSLLYNTKNTSGKFDIEIVSYQSSEIQSIKIDANSILEDEKNARKNKNKEFPVEFNLEFVDADTALLTVNNFSSEVVGPKRKYEKYLNLLKNSFKEIKKKNVQYLVLDIRNNNGTNEGNENVLELLSYLINKPFKEYKFRKVNFNKLPLYPEYLDELCFELLGFPSDIKTKEIKEKFQEKIESKFYLEEDGYYYKKEYMKKKYPNKYLFTGNLYILISGKVFSGGALFSALARDKTNAIFIGEETGGGYYRHSGTIPLFYTLPYSKIFFMIYIATNEHNVKQKIFPNGRGILPHFEVYPTINDFVEGKDTILNFVKKKIKSKKEKQL